MAHASDKVTVRRGNAALAGCQDAHVAAQARSARRCADYSARLDKGCKQALFHRLQVDGLCSGDHDTTYSLCYLMSFQDLRCGAKVGHITIRTGTDNDLIDNDVADLIKRYTDIGRFLRTQSLLYGRDLLQHILR